MLASVAARTQEEPKKKSFCLIINNIKVIQISKVSYSLWNDSKSSEEGKTVLGTTQEFFSSHNPTQNHKGLWRIGWKIKQYFAKISLHIYSPQNLFFSWGDINRVYSPKSDLDAKEFCKLSLFYYLTWWWTELKSTMTKENARLCNTPGKEQGMNCRTDSPNASCLVILKLLLVLKQTFHLLRN